MVGRVAYVSLGDTGNSGLDICMGELLPDGSAGDFVGSAPLVRFLVKRESRPTLWG